MMRPNAVTLCRRCPPGTDCACTDRAEAILPPDDAPMMLGYVYQAGSPKLLGRLDDMCGPRLFPKSAADTSTVALRHRGRTILAWQSCIDRLPHIGQEAAGETLAETMKTLAVCHALSESYALLIDAPEQSARFQANYRRGRGELFSADDDWVGRLVWTWQQRRRSPRVIALHVGAGQAKQADVQRLKTMAVTVQTYPDRAAALQWLLGQVPPMVSRNAAAASRPKLKPSVRVKRAKRAPPPLRTVVIADVGGSVGRRMLASLHARRMARDGVVRLPWQRWSWPIKLECARDDVSIAHVQSATGLALAPGQHVPDLEATIWKWRRMRITVGLNSPKVETPPMPAILCLGADRLFGAGELAAALEQVWSRRWIIAAIVSDYAGRDARLAEWAATEFEGVPWDHDTDAGRLKALGRACRLLDRG